MDFSSVIRAHAAGIFTFQVTAISSKDLVFDSLSSAHSNDNTKLVRLGKVTNVLLSDKGVVSWGAVVNNNGYEVTLYKDGVAQTKTYKVEKDKATINLAEEIQALGDGKYEVSVKAIGNETYFEGALSEKSAAVTIKTLPVTSKISWDGNVARWNLVVSAVGYKVNLFKNGVLIGIVSTMSNTNFVDFASMFSGVGEYTFRVTVIGNDYLIKDSLESVPSTIKTVAVKVDKVTGVKCFVNGITSWNLVKNASSYDVKLYDKVGKEVFATNVSASTTSYNLIEEIKKADLAEYSVRVFAKGTGKYYLDGDASDAVSQRRIYESGYAFAGWYRDKALKNPYNFSSKVTSGFTLYAKWLSRKATLNNISMTNLSGIDHKFAGSITAYSAKVKKAVNSIVMELSKGDSNQTIYLNGEKLDTLRFSLAINPGRNIFKIKVVAADGITTEIYEILIVRLKKK